MDQAVTYTARFDTSPGQTISFVFITFAPWPSEPYSCKVGVAINPFDGTPQGIYLHDDQGNEFNSMPFRSGNTEENSQCLLNASSSYVDPEATYVNVVFTLTFKSPFNGFRNLWVDAADTSSPAPTWTNGWLLEGGLDISGGQVYSPEILSVSSPFGVSRQNDTQEFAVKVREQSGGLSIWHLEFMLSPGNASSWTAGYNLWPNRCKVVAETTANLFWLENNNIPSPDQQNSPVGGLIIKPGPDISNSACTFHTGLIKAVQVDEFTIIMYFALSFNGYNGFLQDHVYVNASIHNAGWSTWDTQNQATCLNPNTATCPTPGWWHWYVWPTSAGPLPSVPSSFLTCIARPGSSCPLSPHKDSANNTIPYVINRETLLPASGVSIYSTDGAAIQRDSQYDPGLSTHPPDVNDPVPMLDTGSSSNVSVQGLTILGNRYGVAATHSSTINALTTLDVRCLDSPDNNRPIPGALVANSVNCADLRFHSPNTSFYNNYVRDSGAHAISVTDPAVNTTIYGNEIDETYATGVLATGSAPNQTDPTQCASGSRYSTQVPRNTVISNNIFRVNSTGAISVFNGIGFTIDSNQLYDNFQNFAPVEGATGGVIVDQTCAVNEVIQGNRIEGLNVGNPGSQGMELYGVNAIVRNNTLTNIPQHGIYLNGSCGTTIYGNSVTKANQKQSGLGGIETLSGGIYLTDQLNPSILRTLQDVSVTYNTSSNNWSGVAFYLGSSTFPPAFQNVAVENNCLINNRNSAPYDQIFPVNGTSMNGVVLGNNSICPVSVPSPPPPQKMCGSYTP